MIGGILYGLGAALGWGVSDFMAARAVRTLGVTLTIVYLQVIGILSFGVVLALVGDLPQLALPTWAGLFGISLFNSAGAFFIYRAYMVGTVSLVAPIVSSYGVITLALAVLFSGEQPTQIAIGGALITVFGVILVSMIPPDRTGATQLSLRGIPAALGAMLSFGIYLWAIDLVIADTGVLLPVMTGKITDMLLAIGLLFVRRRPFIRPSRGLWWRIIAVSTLNSIGFLAYNIGVTMADAAIVGPISSLASPVTILLAWLFFRERLSRIQWAGVTIILIGVILISQ
jgi:drug/metabolite transporter (DMT)-like permease